MGEDRQQVSKLWTGVFVALIAIMFCCFLVGQGLNSGTSVFLERLGYSTSLAGVLALLFSASSGFTRIFVARPIDTGRASLVIAVGCAFLCAGVLLPALVRTLPALVLARCLQGVGFAAATTAANTAVADVLPADRLGEGIGYSGLGQALAMSIGPGLAIFLAGSDPAYNLFLGLSLVAVAGLLLALSVRYEKRSATLPESCAFRLRQEGRIACKKAPRGVQAFFEKRALPGAIPMVVNGSAFGFAIFFVGLYGTRLGVANAGLFYTISAASMFLIRLKSRSFMDRVLPIKTYTAAIASGLAAYGLLWLCPGCLQLYYLAGIFYGLCLGISLPLNQTVAVKNSPSSRWGATNALFLLANDVGIGCASMIWGILNEAFGFGFTLPCVMAALVAAYVLAWIFYPPWAKRSGRLE